MSGWNSRFGIFVHSFQMTHSLLRPEASAGCEEACFL